MRTLHVLDALILDITLLEWIKNRKKWVTMETTDPGGISVPWSDKKTPAHVGVGDNMRFVLSGRELSSVESAMIEAHGARVTAIIDREQIDAMRRHATVALEALETDKYSPFDSGIS